MSFLDDVQLQNGTSGSAPSGSSFLDSINAPPADEDKIYQYQQEAKQAQEDSKKANSFGTIIKETMNGLNDDATNVFSAANDAIKNTWDTYKQFPNKFWNDLKGSVSAIKNFKANPNDKGNIKGSIVDAAGQTVNVAMPLGDIANAIFAPISAAFGAAMQSMGGQKLLDHVGNTIVDKSGITDKPAFQQYALQHPDFARKFNNMLMLATVGTAEYGTSEVPKQMVDAIHNLAKDTLSQATPEEAPVENPTPEQPTLTPDEKQAAYAKSQGYEPYTPADQLPVIDAGKTVKDSLPTIQVGESVRVTKNTNGDYVYEPIKETQPAQPTPAASPETNKTTTQIVPSERPTLPDGTRVTKSASDINDIIKEQGYATLPSAEQAKYEPGSYNQDLVTSKEMVENDFDKAFEAVKEGKPVAGIKYPQILFNEVKNSLTDNLTPENYEKLKQLETSPLNTARSEGAGTLGSSGFNNGSAADAIDEVKKAREEFTNKKSGKGIRENTLKNVSDIVDQETKSITPKNWDDFKSKIIDSLTCKI